MDPAFSLADELADVHRDGLEFHPHTYADFAASSLDDEFAELQAARGSALDAELEGLHLHDSLAAGGSLAAELDPSFTDNSTFADGQASFGGDASPRFNAEIDPSTSGLRLAPAADISDTIDATDRFVALLGGGGGVDGDGKLEAAAAGFLKLVSQSSVEREQQLRELRELDRRLERDVALSSIAASNSWASDLASTSLQEDSPTTPTRRRRSTSSLSDASTIAPPPPHLLDSTLFAPLYTATSHLLGSLTSLHEHAQVTKSSTADAARKLKAVKGLIGQWKGEVENVESSEGWIRQQGAEERRGKQWVEEQVEWCRKRWEVAEGRAKVLLTPVGILT